MSHRRRQIVGFGLLDLRRRSEHHHHHEAEKKHGSKANAADEHSNALTVFIRVNFRGLFDENPLSAILPFLGGSFLGFLRLLGLLGFPGVEEWFAGRSLLDGLRLLGHFLLTRIFVGLDLPKSRQGGSVLAQPWLFLRFGFKRNFVGIRLRRFVCREWFQRNFIGHAARSRPSA